MKQEGIIYTILTLGFLFCFWKAELFTKAFWSKKPKQMTWCYCPACKVDLCSNDSLIYDHPEKSEVVYKCKEKGCGNVSWWNFDIAPIPILIKSDEGSTQLKQREEPPCEQDPIVTP